MNKYYLLKQYFLKFSIIIGGFFSCCSLLKSALPEELSLYENATKDITSTSLAEWTILIYMEADNNLSPCAVGNVEDMRKAPSSNNVNLLVQWDKPRSKMTYRFKIENHKLTDVGSLNQEMGMNPAKELYDAMAWVKANYPAKHYMLVLWNHGGGILEKMKRSWLRPLCDTFPNIAALNNDALVVDDSIAVSLEDFDDRGILYNEPEGTFLSTDAMTTVFNDIKVLLEQEIDVVGMDACLMAMLEIAYAIKHSTEVLVASENLEPGEGWNYGDIIKGIVKQDGKVSAEEIAALVVSAYKKYYLKRDSSYTQSAMKVSQIEDIKDLLNKVVIDFLMIKSISRDVAQKILESAYSASIKFHDDYVDLYSFCDGMSEIVNLYYPVYLRYRDQAVYKELVVALSKLQSSLITLKLAIKHVAFSNSVGADVSNARGISIYLPNLSRVKPHPSYSQCLFARQSLWGQLLSFYAPDRGASSDDKAEPHLLIFPTSAEDES